MQTYDFVVIGGGSAGYAGARTAAALGLRTAVVEGAGEMGGLCIRRGCMPSKTLLESAQRFQQAREAAEFGVYCGELGFSGRCIIERKRRLVGEFAAYRVKQLEEGSFDLLRGHGRFLDARTVEVDGPGGVRVLSGRTFLLATGSVVRWPDIPGLAEAGVWTSDEVLENSEVPGSLVVLGAGPVALELAWYHAALGTKVTVLQRSPHVLRAVDHDVAQVLQRCLEAAGVRVVCNTRLVAVRSDAPDRKVVEFVCGGQREELRAEAVLQALGREPCTAGLQLAAAGLAPAEGGAVTTNRRQQSGVPHIFAAGDVTGELEIVHIAIQQGEVAARNAARLLRDRGEALEEMDYRLKLFAVFTRPEVAQVGLTEQEAREAGRNPAVALYPFNDHGKSMVMAETDGFVKLLADRGTGEILGGAVVGPHGADLIHEVVVAMRYRATAAEFAAIPHYHPTLSEIWTYPAEELAGLCGGAATD